ncbi:MAG: DegV family protein, partial [Lachnospiraceae bacterium]|nr:DegV family protein [Lachnospiraceae bacterium]
MEKVAIMTDSNSGITQKEGKELAITVLPMPFTINGEAFYEDINLTQEEFYKRLQTGADIATSQPAAGDVLDTWKKLLTEYDSVVHIPMSSGLSGSCETAVI